VNLLEVVENTIRVHPYPLDPIFPWKTCNCHTFVSMPEASPSLPTPWSHSTPILRESQLQWLSVTDEQWFISTPSPSPKGETHNLPEFPSRIQVEPSTEVATLFPLSFLSQFLTLSLINYLHLNLCPRTASGEFRLRGWSRRTFPLKCTGRFPCGRAMGPG
jgi:hypothetical protein